MSSILNKYVCLFLLFFCLNACSFFAKPQTIKIHIKAANYLNPDITGEASPVKLTFYALKNNTLFDKVNFFKLQDNPIQALGGALIDERSMMIRSDEQLSFTYQFSPDTRYLGIIAAYRQLAFAEWKKVVSLSSDHIKKVNVILGANSLAIDEL